MKPAPRRLLPCLALGAIFAGPAWANVPMLPFFAFIRLALWWVVLLALLIESVALRLLFGMNWRQAVRAALILNAISLGCGVFLYPLAGLLGYALLEDMIVDLFGASDFVEMSALWIGASVVDTIVELSALSLFWSLSIDFKRGFGFLIANLASASVLIAVMAWEAHIPEMPAAEAARVEAEYVPEITFLRSTLEEFPDHVIVPDAPSGFPELDREWAKGLPAKLDTLRIRTMALSVPPTTVWAKGSTALWDVDARFRERDRTVDKGFVDIVYVGRQPQPTGSPHYRYRIELELDGTRYAIEATLRNSPS